MMDDINKIQKLIETGIKLVPEAGNRAYGYNGEGQASFVAWRTQVLQTLDYLSYPMDRFIRQIEEDKDGKYYYDTSVSNILGILEGVSAFLRSHDITPEVSTSVSSKLQESDQKKVFIVHGHDDVMKVSVARVIEKLGFEPIILHEKANMGKTIIEKFETHSLDVLFAIILMSPDDMGCKADEFPDSARSRARQNVILELGYFTGTLGRERVFVLAKDPDTLELPSDIFAVLYTPYRDGWENKLVQEMKECGIDVDMNKLL